MMRFFQHHVSNDHDGGDGSQDVRNEGHNSSDDHNAHDDGGDHNDGDDQKFDPIDYGVFRGPPLDLELLYGLF